MLSAILLLLLVAMGLYAIVVSWMRMDGGGR